MHATDTRNIDLWRTRSAKRLAAAFVIVALVATAATTALAGGDWNDGAMNWRDYEAGLAEAKRDRKPVCLVFYTDWCPHCAKYSQVFHDKKVVEESKNFVVIRLNKDQHSEISAKYDVDGQYIPRTYFLSPDGVLDKGITENRPNYKFFYDTVNPAGLLAGMGKAKAKYSN